jgi:hypothetical protein
LIKNLNNNSEVILTHILPVVPHNVQLDDSVDSTMVLKLVSKNYKTFHSKDDRVNKMISYTLVINRI